MQSSTVGFWKTHFGLVASAIVFTCIAIAIVSGHQLQVLHSETAQQPWRLALGGSIYLGISVLTAVVCEMRFRRRLRNGRDTRLPYWIGLTASVIGCFGILLIIGSVLMGITH